MPRTLALALALFAAPVLAGDDFAFWPGADYDPAVPTVEAVLGHAPGDEITPPAEVIRYFEALVAAAPERVRLTEYATSWEGRPLIYAAVGSAAHVARLDDLRAAMQALADPRRTGEAEAKQLIADTPAAVWLAYAVHGNEISSTDAAMLTAYHLLASQGDPVVEKILAETVVFIDPLQNPDGRARFVHGFAAARGLVPDADPLAAEHVEPWPSGRTNHYLFDMNRDWIALTQPETQGRIAALLEWYPLVFVDLHEMGSNSTYYFAPEAVPYNPHIAADQRASLEIFGRNNARWFDRYGIDYFTREVFDAFYPGYGASWPLYYGAVAMTYEQASSRGLVMRRRNGTELPYRETVRSHFVTSISTAEAAAENREQLLSDFYDYRTSAVAAGKSGDRTYFLDGGGDPTTADKLAGVLVQQGVEVARATAGFTACGRAYPAGTYAVDLAQPAHRLIRTLLDPQVAMEADFLAEQERRRAKDLEHEIYDVTAWSLALMWNVELTACDRAPAGDFEPAGPETVRPGALRGAGATVAYLVPWGTQAAARLLAGALRAGLAVKTSDKAFRQAGREVPAGTLIFKVPDNPENLAGVLADLARDTGAEVVGTSDSWVDEGPNFGSMNVFDVPAPRIAVAWDLPAGAYAAGNARFVVERLLGYPVTAVRGRTLARADLRRFDVLILPEEAGGRYGSYDEILGRRGAENLQEWVAAGGTLVVLGNAMEWAADPAVDLVAARREDAYRETGGEDKKSGGKDGEEGRATVPGILLADGEALAAAVEPERQAPDSLPGALVKAVVDGDHWLAAGVNPSVPVMARGSDVYAPLKLDQGTNVAVYAGADELLLSGYLWQENHRQLAYKPFVMIQPRGRGLVVGFTEDPTFRAYLDGLNLLLANALFRAPAHARPVR